MTFTAALIGLLALLSQVSLAQQAPKPQAAPAAAVAAASASNPAGSLHEALAKSTPKFRTLLDVIKLTPANVPKNAVGTFFAPNDAAVDVFLKGMGLTAAELAAQPDLADLMVAYHFIPGYQFAGPETVKGPKKAATGDENFIVTLLKGPGGNFVVKDVQGNVAGVVSGPVKIGKLWVYVIDTVLMSGNYFNSTISALAYNPGWITTYGYAKLTGVDKALAAAKDPYTLFVPTNKAWKPIEPDLMVASNAVIADTLKYHVTPKALQVPKDFKGVTSLPTLLTGHSIKVTSNLTATASDRYRNNAEVARPDITLIPELSYPAKITSFNIYAGKNILHAIDGALQPNMTAKTATPAAAAAAAAAGSKPGGGAAAVPSKITTEAATKPAAAAAAGATAAGATPTKATPAAIKASPAAAVKPAGATGRRLLSSSSSRRLQQAVAGRLLDLGSIQTSPGGFTATSRTLDALTASATGTIPVQYPNRFGALPEAAAANGCLNCLKWAKP